MRNSDSPLGAPLSQYAQQFALDHLGNFLGTLDDSPSSTNSEQISVIDLLNGPIFEDGQTALEAACHAGKWMVARALVNANVEVNVRFQEFPVGPICALHSACFGEQLDLIYLLLEKGADPNIISPNKDAGRFNDGTALAFAAWKADINLVTQLLTCGADPNLQGGYFNTSLQAACTAGSLEVINFLLNNGADPNLRGGAFGSALHACACRGYNSCAARALLQHKADPNIQDEDDTTPLHEACYWGNIKVVECLLEYKVDASMKNNENQTALQTAQYRGKQDVVELFLQHGIVA